MQSGEVHIFGHNMIGNGLSIKRRIEFLKNVRDVKMLAFLVVFPIVISYIIGEAVGGFGAGAGNPTKVNGKARSVFRSRMRT